MPAAALVASGLLTAFTRSFWIGPALILLLLTTVIFFERNASRTSEHLIDVQVGLWLGALIGFLFLWVSNLKQLVDFNILQPTINWPLFGLLVALVLVAGAGSLTASSYTDGAANVLNLMFMVGGLLLFLVAFFGLAVASKLQGRPPFATVKYGLVLTFLVSVLLFAPQPPANARSVVLFLLLGIVVHLLGLIIAYYVDVADDPLPTFLSQVLVIVSSFVLSTGAVLLPLLVSGRLNLLIALAVGLVWAAVFGVLLRLFARRSFHVQKQDDPSQVESARPQKKPPSSAKRKSVRSEVEFDM